MAKIAAGVCGGKHEKRRQVENLVAVISAGRPGRAAGLAEVRREHGSNLLLRHDATFATANGGCTGHCR